VFGGHVGGEYARDDSDPGDVGGEERERDYFIPL
jgi:hypothetical protein